MNKIDLPSANPEEVTDEIVNLFGCKPEDVLRVSGKLELVFMNFEQIVEKNSSAKGDENAPLQALIFDSVYNPFRGIEAYFKVVNSKISKGESKIHGD